ncbi:MAG: TldD/PmbA family protein [Methanobacteriaceae archaeon]|jgi:TldD protein|nr:TldD/PmbA family protein [Methanobacteriaceae archaeon]
MEKYIDLFKKIIENTSTEADYVDIRAGKGKNTNLVMKDGQVQLVNTGTILGARIRVLKNGTWGFAYTNEIEKLEEIAETSIKISNSLKGDIELSKSEIIEDKVKTPCKIPLSSVDIEEKKELINDVHKSANIENVKSITVNYSDNELETFFISSEGSSISVDESRVGLFLNVVASEGNLIQFGHSSMGGVKGYEVFENEDIDKFAREVSEKATRLLKASTPPSGKFPIIADNELTGVCVHEALGHAVEGDLILQNDSILKGKLGENIGSDIVNIVDDASLKDGFGYYPYDVEGTKTQRNQLIKDGELVSLLTSRESASKLNRTSSGNARSSLSDQPIVRMSNTFMEPGDMSFDELIEDIKDGIYLKGSRGGQVDTGKGIFQFNAAESFKIKNGEIKEPLRDVSLSGNILETLKNVDALGSDFKLGIGFCGKSGQTAPVGDGGPHTRILDALVGGSS